MINTIFLDLLDKGVAVFIDDILVYLHGFMEEHTKPLAKVFERCRKHGIALEMNKCKLYRQEVKFLGFMVNRKGIRMVDDVIKAIDKYGEPESKEEVQRFIEFTNFFRGFIQSFSDIMASITYLMKNMPFHWNKEQIDAFVELKQKFVSLPILLHYNLKKESRIETNASKNAIGTVLSQKQQDRTWHPVAFWSKKFTDAE